MLKMLKGTGCKASTVEDLAHSRSEFSEFKSSEDEQSLDCTLLERPS